MGLTTESKRGSNCTGVDGTQNRQLTLANTTLTNAGSFMVNVNGLQLVPVVDYTANHLVANTTIIFLNIVFDTDYLVIVYLQAGSPAVGSRYCTFTDVYTKTGLSTSEVASAIVDALILDAEAELDTLTGRAFTNANGLTEYFSIKDKDVIGNASTSIQLNHFPVQSIISFTQRDLDDNATITYATLTALQIAAGTFSTADYWLQVQNDPLTNTALPNGRVTLKTGTFPKGTNNVQISYTFGYDSVPQLIKDLATCLSGVRVWMAFMGASYNRLNSYSIPQQNVNKGDFYARCLQNVTLLTDEANRVLDRVGRKPRTLFFSSGDTR